MSRDQGYNQSRHESWKKIVWPTLLRTGDVTDAMAPKELQGQLMALAAATALSCTRSNLENKKHNKPQQQDRHAQQPPPSTSYLAWSRPGTAPIGALPQTPPSSSRPSTAARPARAHTQPPQQQSQSHARDPALPETLEGYFSRLELAAAAARDPHTARPRSPRSPPHPDHHVHASSPTARPTAAPAGGPQGFRPRTAPVRYSAFLEAQHIDQHMRNTFAALDAWPVAAGAGPAATATLLKDLTAHPQRPGAAAPETLCLRSSAMPIDPSQPARPKFKMARGRLKGRPPPPRPPPRPASSRPSTAPAHVEPGGKAGGKASPTVLQNALAIPTTAGAALPPASARPSSAQQQRPSSRGREVSFTRAAAGPARPSSASPDPERRLQTACSRILQEVADTPHRIVHALASDAAGDQEGYLEHAVSSFSVLASASSIASEEASTPSHPGQHPMQAALPAFRHRAEMARLPSMPSIREEDLGTRSAHAHVSSVQRRPSKVPSAETAAIAEEDSPGGGPMSASRRPPAVEDEVGLPMAAAVGPSDSGSAAAVQLAVTAFAVPSAPSMALPRGVVVAAGPRARGLQLLATGAAAGAVGASAAIPMQRVR